MKKLWLILAGGLLLACACPSIPLTIPRSTPPPTEEVHPAEPVITGDLTVTQLQPEAGDLTDQLQEEASKASALGQQLFVEFDASW